MYIYILYVVYFVKRQIFPNENFQFCEPVYILTYTKLKYI